MFTGLIEEIGEISAIKQMDNAICLTVEADKILNDLKIGDSIAINGACQTVIEFSDNSFTVFASIETLKLTDFSSFKSGTKVNLERTLRLGDRLDGHLVSGHVDGTAKISSINKEGDTIYVSFETPDNLLKQIVKKGSVAVDGISLTVTDVKHNAFSVSVIPHTVKSTNLQYKHVGDFVNIETDLIGKYVEKYLFPKHNSSNIDMNLLERNGFL